MLRRARKLENSIILRFSPHVEELLRRGPPKLLIKITAALEAPVAVVSHDSKDGFLGSVSHLG